MTLEEMKLEIERLRAKRINRILASPVPLRVSSNHVKTQDGRRASYDYDGTPQHVRCEDAPCCGCC